MFDIGWGELLLIGIVALIAIGPKELPGALRTLGQWMGKLRRMASEFQGQFHEAMREAELADLKKQVDEMTTQAQGYANFDPVGEVRKEFESTQQQIESAMSGPPPGDTSSSTAVAAEPTTAPSVEAPGVEAPAVETPNAGVTNAGATNAGATSIGASSTEAPPEPAAPDAVRQDAEGKPA
jgi:sec-independent protein translocase protein TatB